MIAKQSGSYPLFEQPGPGFKFMIEHSLVLRARDPIGLRQGSEYVPPDVDTWCNYHIVV